MECLWWCSSWISLYGLFAQCLSLHEASTITLRFFKFKTKTCFFSSHKTSAWQATNLQIGFGSNLTCITEFLYCLLLVNQGYTEEIILFVAETAFFFFFFQVNHSTSCFLCPLIPHLHSKHVLKLIMVLLQRLQYVYFCHFKWYVI